jgi:hypothetical protein
LAADLIAFFVFLEKTGVKPSSSVVSSPKYPDIQWKYPDIQINDPISNGNTLIFKSFFSLNWHRAKPCLKEGAILV